MNYPIFRKYALLINLLFVICTPYNGFGQSGYRLWLDYKPLPPAVADKYRPQLQTMLFPIASETDRAACDELSSALERLLGHKPTRHVEIPAKKTGVMVGRVGTLPAADAVMEASALRPTTEEAYVIHHSAVDGHSTVVILGNTDKGLLYAVFAFIGALQRGEELARIATV